MTDAGSGAFNKYYFEHCCGRPYRRDEHWRAFFGKIADRIVADIQPKRVFDAGCAMGLLVEALRERGVEAEGIDISEYAIAAAPPAARPHCRVGSITDELPSRYDLVVCIEVVEHVAPEQADAVIANFCRHADDVLFSSSPMDYREPTHVNVQPAEHWAERFARHEFYRDVDFDASFVTSWAVRFRRRRDPVPRIVRDYERRFAPVVAERNERRQFVAEVQHQLEAALERIQRLEQERDAIHQDRLALEQELGLVRAALEHTHADLTRKVVEFDAVRAESDQRSHELTHARETIRLMEQSFFWRVRRWLGRR